MYCQQKALRHSPRKSAQWDDDPKLQAQHSDKSWFITWSQVEQDLKKQQPAGV